MPTVIDTVVLHYFLVVDHGDLLLQLLDPPVGVPRIVFDPDDDDATDAMVSELRQNIRFEDRIASEGPEPEDPSSPEFTRSRETAKQRAASLRRVEALVASERLQVLDLTEDEWADFARLTAHRPDSELGLFIPLGDGEAACLAIAIERGHVLATDDGDALRVLDQLASGHPYERTRRLLIRAANTGLISHAQANAIHTKMRDAGFWDTTLPFPAGG